MSALFKENKDSKVPVTETRIKIFSKKIAATLIAQVKINKSGKTVLVYANKLYRIKKQFALP